MDMGSYTLKLELIIVSKNDCVHCKLCIDCDAMLHIGLTMYGIGLFVY